GSGLFFLCFQADISNQFNFMQSVWANANNFVQVNVGVDPIIGQTQRLKLEMVFVVSLPHAIGYSCVLFPVASSA
ncbi:MAG: hypothetical protein ACKPJO_32325, partial [Dolichospermum sp.]